MPCLTDLPAEILLPVLAHLSTIDLPTFLVSQATCRIFRLLARDLLSRPPAPPPSKTTWPVVLSTGQEQDRMDHNNHPSCRPHPHPHPNPILARDFGPLLSSARCFTSAERGRVRWFLSLDGDAARPFRRLPWAGGGGGGGARRRERYLRPGASWRDLSVTFGVGPPVTRVEVVKNYSSGDLNASDGRDHVQHLEVDLPPAGGGFLTMGLLYDLLLCGGAVGDDGAATLGGETGGWELLLGARLRSHDLLLEYECFIADDEDLVDRGPGAARSAILYVRGGTVEGLDQDRRFGELEDDDDDDDDEVGWVPEILGDVPRIRPVRT